MIYKNLMKEIKAGNLNKEQLVALLAQLDVLNNRMIRAKRVPNNASNLVIIEGK